MDNLTELLKQPFDMVRELLEWRTAAGDVIPVEELGDTHLKNIMIMLDTKQAACDRMALGDWIWAGCTANQWMTVLRKELDFRRKPVKVEKVKVVL